MAAGLDGKLHHWRLTDWQHQESGPSVADTEEGKVINGYHVRKIGTEMTFASSFLPIVLYQDFIHLLLDQPRRE
jgi:CRISPR/Cas system endoribonuclease Cas6 (RAMP superfamily)